MFPLHKTSKNRGEKLDFFRKMFQNFSTSVSYIVTTKLKVVVYARKMLLFLLKFEGGSSGLEKKSHIVEKIRNGDPLVSYFCKHIFLG